MAWAGTVKTHIRKAHVQAHTHVTHTHNAHRFMPVLKVQVQHIKGSIRKRTLIVQKRNRSNKTRHGCFEMGHKAGWQQLPI